MPLQSATQCSNRDVQEVFCFTYNAPDDGTDDNEEGSDGDTSLDPRLIKS